MDNAGETGHGRLSEISVKDHKGFRDLNSTATSDAPVGSHLGEGRAKTSMAAGKDRAGIICPKMLSVNKGSMGIYLGNLCVFVEEAQST
jgi:hypothetical protein